MSKKGWFVSKPKLGVLSYLNYNYNAYFVKEDKFLGDEISLYAKDIAGVVSGLKRFTNKKQHLVAQGTLFDDSSTYYVDDYDILGIGVMDILQGNFVDVAVKPVRAISEGVTTRLRLLQMNIDYSDKYKEVYEIDDTPVVLAGDIFYDVFGLNVLGEELLDEGYDVWLVELTGGPHTDCIYSEFDDCPNYDYNDVAFGHFPASIGGILGYTNKDKVHYIGHGNGGRVALTYLNSHSDSNLEEIGSILNFSNGNWELVSIPKEPIDKYFGIGVPSTLNGETFFTNISRNYGQGYFPTKVENRSHIYFYEIVGPLISEHKRSESFNPVSFKDYFFLTQSDTLMWQLNGLKVAKGFIAGLVFDYLNQNYFDGVDQWTAIGYSNGLVGMDSKVSTNLMKYYLDLATSEDSTMNLNGVKVNKLYLFNSNESFIGEYPGVQDYMDFISSTGGTVFSVLSEGEGDFVVPITDSEYIYNNTVQISSEDKEVFDFINFILLTDHTGLPEDFEVIQIIKNKLKDE